MKLRDEKYLLCDMNTISDLYLLKNGCETCGIEMAPRLRVIGMSSEEDR